MVLSGASFQFWGTAARDNPPRMTKTDAVRPSETWACRAVGEYRGLKADAAAFSNDGSVVAILFQGNMQLLFLLMVPVSYPVDRFDCDAVGYDNDGAVAYRPTVSRYPHDRVLWATPDLRLGDRCRQLGHGQQIGKQVTPRSCTAGGPYSIVVQMELKAPMSARVAAFSSRMFAVATDSTVHLMRPDWKVPLLSRKLKVLIDASCRLPPSGTDSPAATVLGAGVHFERHNPGCHQSAWGAMQSEGARIVIAM